MSRRLPYLLPAAGQLSSADTRVCTLEEVSSLHHQPLNKDASILFITLLCSMKMQRVFSLWKQVWFLPTNVASPEQQRNVFVDDTLVTNGHWPYKPSENGRPTYIASSYFPIKLNFLHNYFIFTDEHTWREIHKFSRVTIGGNSIRNRGGLPIIAHIYSFQRLHSNLWLKFKLNPEI